MNAIDWESVLALLPRWAGLSPEARRAALSILSGVGTPAAAVGGARKELDAAGFTVARGARGTGIALAEEVTPLMELLQGVARVPLLERPIPTMLYAYVSQRFRPAEVARALSGNATAWSYPHPARMALRVGSTARLEEFLSLEGTTATRRWAKVHLPEERYGGKDAPTAVAAAQRLIRALLEQPEAVPLAGVAALLPDLAAHEVAAALDVATRLLFLFPALDGEALPRVGPWPPLARRLGRPLGPPPPVEAVESFDAPWLLGDMTAVLVEAAAEPIRVRADGAIFVRAARAISARLAPVPAWLPALLRQEDDPFGIGEEEVEDDDPLDRVAVAAGWLEAMGLLAQRGREAALEATAAGKGWLARPERDRLGRLLDHFRKQKERNPPGPYGAEKALPFFPVRLGIPLPRGLVLDVRAALTEALLTLPDEGVVSCAHFLDHRAREGNPFLDSAVREALGPRGWEIVDEDEQWEGLWMEILNRFLVERLAPLGGLRLGRLADGGLGVGLTAIGRYLLGAADDFAIETTAETGAVVVQPDFEVVFLAPAPRAEAEIGRFAERIGAGVDATFRITRASVLRAAEAGAGEEEIVSVLRDSGGREPPANVARQIRDWLASVRRVSVATAMLVDCPDEETAARVLSAAGKAAEALTPTVVRLVDGSGKARAVLVKKLRAAGIFVGGS